MVVRHAITCNDHHRCVPDKNLVHRSILLSPVIQPQVGVKWDIELHIPTVVLRNGCCSSMQTALQSCLHCSLKPVLSCLPAMRGGAQVYADIASDAVGCNRTRTPMQPLSVTCGTKRACKHAGGTSGKSMTRIALLQIRTRNIIPQAMLLTNDCDWQYEAIVGHANDMQCAAFP